MSSIQILHWESNDIPRRADGYFNATFMCKAGGKLWGGWWRLDSTQALLQALAADMQIPTTELAQSIRGGISHQQGTWVHPQVALALAMWISPAFAAWCLGVLHQVVEPATFTIPDGEVAQVESRIQGNLDVGSAAGTCGAAYNIAHDQKNIAATGHNTAYWRQVAGTRMWLECMDPQDQALMGVMSRGMASRMLQANATGASPMQCIKHGASGVRILRDAISEVMTPGGKWEPKVGTSRVHQLSTVKNRQAKLKSQRKPKAQQPTFPSLFD